MKETVFDIDSVADCSVCKCHVSLNGCHICKFYGKVSQWTHKEHPEKPAWCKVHHITVYEEV